MSDKPDAFHQAHATFMYVHAQSKWEKQTLDAFDEMRQKGTTTWPDWFKPLAPQSRGTIKTIETLTHPPIKGNK